MSAATDPWTVRPDAYPQAAPPAERLRFLIAYAVLAPSSHNSQPWRFRVTDESVELRADPARCLTVVDPERRELVISCGAALCHLRIALRAFGHAGSVDVLPDRGDPDLLARVGFGEPVHPPPEDLRLLEAITRRRTNRRAFEDRPVPQPVVDRLREAAAAGGAWFAPIEDEATRAAVAALVAEGDRRQFADPGFRRELASWIRSRRSDDGLRRPLPPLTHLVLRTFDVGGRAAAHDRELAAGSPLLAVIGTEGDDAEAWLGAGQALALVLLSARERGVWASFLNQPVEVSDLRPRLREVVGRGGHPQLLLRLGYGPRVGPAPRRPVEAVLVP